MPQLPNLKHEAFAQKYARGLVQSTAPSSATTVYSELYHCEPDSARASAARLLAEASVRERIYDLISVHNPPEALAADLERLRHARKGVYHKGKKVAEEPDHATRLQAVALSLRAQGGLQPEDQPAIDARSLNFHLHSLNPEHVKQIAETLTRLNHDLGLQDGNSLR